jgi:hypothetical protein
MGAERAHLHRWYAAAWRRYRVSLKGRSKILADLFAVSRPRLDRFSRSNGRNILPRHQAPEANSVSNFVAVAKGLSTAAKIRTRNKPGSPP